MILVIGAPGQLGQDLMKVLDGEALGLSHRDIEVRERESVARALDLHRPRAVINTSAYHRVDLCEQNPDQALAVNAVAVAMLAEECAKRDVYLVHFSTDYVFDGAKGSPYAEDDAPNPINVYGVSKLAGEVLLRLKNSRSLAVRTSSLFGVAGSSGKGGNFVETILKRAREQGYVDVVNNIIMKPTYTRDLAQKVAEVAAREVTGVLHITNGGQGSWFDFAREIVKQAGIQAEVRPTQDQGQVPRRPHYSALANATLVRQGFQELRPWPEALAAYLAERPERAGLGLPL